MPYVDPTSTPRAPPGAVNIKRIASDHDFVGVSSHAFTAAQGQPIDVAELSERNSKNGALGEPLEDDLLTVPRHHNEDALCCPRGSLFELVVSCCSLTPCCWLGWCGACQRLEARQEAAIYLQGLPYAHVGGNQQQWLCINPCLQVEEYTKNVQMVNLDEVKAADADGSPIVLSGVVTYSIADPWRYFVTGNPHNWLHNQGLVVMKEVASRYPYDAAPGQVSLRTRGSRNIVVNSLRSEMQQRVKNLGLRINSFEFTDMHYAKEVAAQMLVTQQAKATVNARRLIVDGAVGIVTETVEKLEGVGIAFTSQQKADLVRSLLVMSVSDSPAQTTVAV